MTTSVVLTTYNGIKYIEQLLDSLRMQTRRVNEILIFDDGSKDGTVNFIREYIEKYNLSGWSININKTNKGWKQNFRDGILAASGDVIFPCDQDDIWKLNKIEKMCDAFEKNSKVLLLSSEYTPLYEDGGHKVDTFQHHSEELQFVKDDEKFSVHTRPGCVMAVKRTFAISLSDIWKGNYAHDAFLWTAATVSGGNYLLNVPLIQYRRHSNNASTGAHRTIDNQILLMKMGKNIVRWYRSTNKVISKDKSKMLDGYLEWNELRSELLQSRKLGNLIRLIKYRKYFRSTRQELGDLYYLIRGKWNCSR